jgi:hypothetical protein
MFDSQRYEFLGDTLSAVALVGVGEPNDMCYTFPVAYSNANAFGR